LNSASPWPNAARKIDKRLLFAQRPQHLDCSLQRRQLTIRVEDVELTGILSERSRSIDDVQILVVIVFRVHQRLDGLIQQIAIVREVQQHTDDASRKRHDRHQVRLSHLCLDELTGRRKRAILIRRRHRHGIEIQNHKPAVAIFQVSRTSCGNHRRRDFGNAVLIHLQNGLRPERRKRRVVQPLKVEDADGLANAVFGDREIPVS